MPFWDTFWQAFSKVLKGAAILILSTYLPNFFNFDAKMASKMKNVDKTKLIRMSGITLEPSLWKKALIGRIQLALSVVEQTEKSDAKIISKMANENEARTFL